MIWIFFHVIFHVVLQKFASKTVKTQYNPHRDVNFQVKCATCSCTCTNQGLSGMLLYDMPRKVCIIQVCIPLVWKGVVWVKVIVNILNVAKGRLDGEGGGDGMWSNFYALFKISYFKIIVKYDMRCLVGKELGVSEFFPTHSQPSQLSQLRREVLNYCQKWLYHKQI